MELGSLDLGYEPTMGRIMMAELEIDIHEM
jgi:hypothetical protein